MKQIKDMMQIGDISATVLGFSQLMPDLFTFRVSRPDEMCAKVGQFAMFEAPGHTLRRPISIAIDEGGEWTFFVRIVGDGTKDIHQRIEDMYRHILDRNIDNKTLNLSGPFGNGFPLEGKKWLIVGGGIGIAPLFGIAAEANGCKPVCILGTNTVEEAMVWRSKLRLYMPDGKITNSVINIAKKDDFVAMFGTDVFHGNVAECLADYFAKNPKESFDAAYVCGPIKMELAVAEVLAMAEIPTWVSLEERMACGIGSCLSCAINGTDDGKGQPFHVCTDGPVFPSKVILEKYRSQK